MDTERMIRELRNIAEKHRDDLILTGHLNISLMCQDVATRLEELKPYEDTGLTPEQVERVKETAKKYLLEKAQGKVGGWIPVEDRLPEEGEKVLVWYEYFRYGEYNRMYETYGISWQYDGYWSGDVSGTNAKCLAWRPLPEPYRPERSESKAMRELGKEIVSGIEVEIHQGVRENERG